MSAPLFSIIIPAYNAENFIKYTVESILKQSIDDWELIIVDDGSTDSTLKLCNDISLIDKRIHVIHKSNGGVSSARNFGVAKSLGEYITFVDADDLLSPYYLYALKSSIDNADISIFPYLSIQSKEEIPPVRDMFELKFSHYTLQDGYIEASKNGLLHSPGSKCYKSTIIKSNNIKFDESIAMGEDLLFNLSYLEFCKSINIGQEPLYYYIISHSVLSRTIRKDYADIQLELYERREKFCQKHNINYTLIPFQYSILYDAVGAILKAENLSRNDKFSALDRISNSELAKSYLLSSGRATSLKELSFRFMLKYPIISKLLITNVRESMYVRLQSVFKYYKNLIDRKRLTNRNFTIITNHCMGGIIYHDLGLRFLSPTINLKILPDDFIEFLEHLEYYLQSPIIETHIPKIQYPVGKILKCGANDNDYIYIHFVHYKTFDEAIEKWNMRVSRVNKENIVVMMTARDGCRDSTLDRFENLSYEKRICYTNNFNPAHPHCKRACNDNGTPLKGYISDMVNIWGKRAFECNGFDYVRFLNGR